MAIEVTYATMYVYARSFSPYSVYRLTLFIYRALPNNHNCNNVLAYSRPFLPLLVTYKTPDFPKLFGHTGNRDAQIISAQAWYGILHPLTIFLAISLVRFYASDVGMSCCPFAPASAIGCVLLPRKIHLI